MVKVDLKMASQVNRSAIFHNSKCLSSDGQFTSTRSHSHFAQFIHRDAEDNNMTHFIKS